MDGKKVIAINSVYIFSKLVITSIISLIVSRWVLDALGPSDYGLYNVVGGIVVILNLLNTAMVTTTYRFIAYEMGKGEKGNINKIFSASFTIHLCLSVFILVIGLLVGLWYVNNILNIDTGNYGDARFILIISVITTSISTLFIPFQGLLVAYENFLVGFVVEVSAKILYLIAVLVLLCKLGLGVKIYALILMLVTVISCLSYFIYCKVNHREVIKFKFVKDKVLYKEMSSFTGWTLLGTTSYVGQTQGSATILNYFFGTGVNAAFAVANQVENFIAMFSRNLSQAAIPQITKSYSGGDNSRSITLTGYISKYTFLLMSMVAFPLLLDMDFILGLWLKSVPDGASLFCKLLILNGLITSLNSGIPALIQATGKIKTFQIIGSIIALLCIPVSIVLFTIGTIPQTIVVVFTVASFINLLVNLALLRHILNIDIRFFFKISFSRVIIIFAFLSLGYIFYNPNAFTLSQHVLGLCLSEVYLFILIGLFGLDKREKEIIKKYIKNRIRK